MVYKNIKLNDYIQNYELKVLKKKDIPRLVLLFKQVMNKNWDANYWNWFLYKNPYETHSLTLWDDDELIGFNCALKKIFLLNEQEFDCILVSTAIVHNDYRGQEIYPYIVKNLYNKLSELGYLLIYGFPNEYYDCRHYSKNKLSWDFCEKKKMLVKDIKNKKFIKKEVVKGREFIISKVNNFPKSINFLNSSKKDCIIFKKTTEYLNWRYTKNPFNKYDNFLIYNKTDNICGFFVLKTYINDKGERFGEIDDYMIYNNNLKIFSSMYQYILLFFLDKNNDYISTWLSTESNNYVFLKENHFKEVEMKTSWGFKILQELNSKERHYILNSKKWDLKMGDSDVF